MAKGSWRTAFGARLTAANPTHKPITHVPQNTANIDTGPYIHWPDRRAEAAPVRSFPERRAHYVNRIMCFT
jgi:hypothetical protein